MGLTVGDKSVILEPGQSHVLPPDNVHTFFNPNDFEMEFEVLFEPALNMEWFGRELIKANNQVHLPFFKFLQSEYILWKARKEYRLASENFLRRNFYRALAVFLSKLLQMDKRVDLSGYRKI